MFQRISHGGVIALLTDFGLSDGYVGMMKGVMLGVAEAAQIVDITHEVAAQDIAAGAWILGTSYRYFPHETVYLCVVDPGVGGQRRPVAVKIGDWYFVGPDNGLLSYVLQEQPVHEAVALSNPAYHLVQVSSTFQGRDIFAPVAAHIVRGIALSELGPSLDPASLRRLDVGSVTQQGERIQGQVVHIDHFGNLVTNIPASMVPTFFSEADIQMVFPGRQQVVSERRRYFAEGESAGKPFLYLDSAGYIGVAVRNSSAARALQVSVGEVIAVQIK